MRTAVVLLARDLRAHDNSALATASADAERVVPLVVLGPALTGLATGTTTWRPTPYRWFDEAVWLRD
jgi:deoxyribodipyrimidine photolyase